MSSGPLSAFSARPSLSATTRARDPTQRATPRASGRMRAAQGDVSISAACAKSLSASLRQSGTAFLENSADLGASATKFAATMSAPRGLAEACAAHEDVYYHVWVAARAALDEGREGPDALRFAMEQLLVEVACALLERVPGTHYTFIDPRLVQRTDMLAAALRLIEKLEARGIARRAVVISILASEHGVRAAQELESGHGVRTALVGIAGPAHAAACVEARPAAMGVPVTTVMKWHKLCGSAGAGERGIAAIQAVIDCLQHHRLPTGLILSDVTAIEVLRHFPGAHAVSVSSEQFEALRACAAPLESAARASVPLAPACKQGMMQAFSATTRTVVVAVLRECLMTMGNDVRALEELVRGELEAQHAVRNLPLAALLAGLERKRVAAPRTPEKRKKSEGVRRDEGYGGEAHGWFDRFVTRACEEEEEEEAAEAEIQTPDAREMDAVRGLLSLDDIMPADYYDLDDIPDELPLF